MTVTVNVVTEDLRTGTTSPQTFSHAGTGTIKGVLLAIMHGTSSTDHVSAASYGGTALTRVERNTDTATEAGAAEWWFLGASVPQGTQTVSYTCGATTDDIHAVCITLAAATDLIVSDVDGINENAANPSVALQVGGRPSMSFAALYSGLTAITSLAPGTNCTAVSTSELTGNFCSYVVRQTTGGTADFTIAVTAASDDVAYAAVSVSERQALTLTAAQGSLSLSGQAVTLTASLRGQVGAPGPLPSIGLLLAAGAPKVMTAVSGSFALSGQSIAIHQKRTAASSSFALSGQSVALSFGRKFAAAAGSFTLTGQAVGLAFGHKFAAVHGSFTLSGQAVTLTKSSQYVLTAGQGSFAFSGQDAAIDLQMAAGHGSVTFNGQAVALRLARNLVAAGGAFALNGQAVTLRRGLMLQAGFSACVLSGQAVTLTQGGSGARTLAADVGVFTLSGIQVLLRRSGSLSAEAGSYALSGQAATLRRGFGLSAAAAVFTITGQDVGLDRSAKTLTAGTGSFALSGQSVGLNIITPAGPLDISAERTIAMPALNRSIGVRGDERVIGIATQDRTIQLRSTIQ